MNSMNNFLRRLRSLVPVAVVRLIRSFKIPLMLFGVCCYQFYHYQRIRTINTGLSRSSHRFAVEPFRYDLYDQIKDQENVIVLLDMGYTEQFENRLHEILSDLATATANNPRKLRILSLRLDDLS